MTAVWIREKEWQTATPLAVAHSKGQKKLFFRQLDMDILNRSIHLSSRRAKQLSH
jgi:hypothetical protein